MPLSFPSWVQIKIMPAAFDQSAADFLGSKTHVSPDANQALNKHVEGTGSFPGWPDVSKLAQVFFQSPSKSEQVSSPNVLRDPHPTLPSKLIATSFCASTANSIGSFCITSRTKPLTSRATASSCDRPRCWA